MMVLKKIKLKNARKLNNPEMKRGITFSLLCLIFFLFFFACSGSFFFGDKKHDSLLFIDAKYECNWNITFISDTIETTKGAQNGFILQIGNNLSYGFGYRDYDWDALYWTVEGVNSIIESFENGTRSTFIDSDIVSAKLYKDYKEKKIDVVDNISGHFFIYEDYLMSQNWIIQDDTMTIAGYRCQKGISHWRGRDWVAWFTPEIPIGDGPWKFYGLPGLIIKLYDTKHHYDFELVEFKEIVEKIDIQPLSTKNIKVLWKTVKLTNIERKKFLQMKFGIQGNTIMNMDMAPIGIQTDWVPKKYGYIELDY